MALLVLPASAQAVHSKFEFLPNVADAGSGAGSVEISVDGTIVAFETYAKVVAQDTDAAKDVYTRSGNALTLVSTGPLSTNEDIDADLNAISEDGSTVVFETRERLTPDDSDTTTDIYARAAGATTLVSTGPSGGTGFHPGVDFVGMTPDASHIFFASLAHFVPADEDTCHAPPPPPTVECQDIFDRSGGTTSLVSTGPNEPFAQDGDAVFLDVSDDGQHVLFRTEEALVAADADGPAGGFIGRDDIYERSGGTTTLVSTSSLNPNQGFGAEFGDASEDGTRVFFRTQEQLTPDDTDGGYDVFERAGGQTTRISTGTLGSNTGAHAQFMGITPDGAHVFFDTPERLESDDGDLQGGDLYRRSGAQTTLISTGPVPVSQPSDLGAVSDDGQRVIFGSVGQFTPSDTDQRFDLYERFAGATTHLTPGNADETGFDGAILGAASKPEANRVIFSTRDQVLPSDTDTAADVYERWNGQFYLLSAPNYPDQETGSFIGASRDAGVVYLRIEDFTFPGGPDGTYRVSVDGTYARPKGATPVQVRLVPAYKQCTTSNRTHGPPLAFGSCSPPQQASGQLTIGTADANGQPTKSEGSLRLDALLGSPATPADEADVVFTLSITDVRRQSDLEDYTGGVRATVPLQVTDRDHTPAPAGLNQGTSMLTEFSFDAACAATTDTTVGSTCGTTTSADAVVPGAVKESKRAVWEMGQLRVYDGGPDSDPTTTADNTLFEVQGILVP